MSLVWIILLCLLAVAWVLTIADMIRQRYSGWTLAGWIALIVILPFVGCVIYWAIRKPTSQDAEAQYLANADVHRRRAGHSPDSTSWEP
jgi:hypothetical protein